MLNTICQIAEQTLGEVTQVGSDELIQAAAKVGPSQSIDAPSLMMLQK
jgi:hypothetical protein